MFIKTAKMETTFYHDDSNRNGLRIPEVPNLNSLKRTMTLDFNSGMTKKSKIQSILASPDLNLLKLASPELEKMLIQASGMVTTTPTPTQFICPKYVTEEQEAYARGFVDALNRLHSNPEDDEMDELNESDEYDDNSMPANVNYTTAHQNILQTFTTTTSLPGSVLSINKMPHHVNHNTLSLNKMSMDVPTTVHLTTLKEEPQTVPCLGELSPPISPINMELQETIKLDRKRARNRVAARKCRTRKLERISRLEDKVTDLKGDNNSLVDNATKLRDQVCKLKQQIMDHVSNGCQVMMGNGSVSTTF